MVSIDLLWSKFQDIDVLELKRGGNADFGSNGKEGHPSGKDSILFSVFKITLTLVSSIRVPTLILIIIVNIMFVYSC